MAKKKGDDVELYFRIRNKSTRELFGSSTVSMFTRIGPCEKKCAMMNRNGGTTYEVVTYELREVNRKLKLDKFFAAQEPEAK